VVHPLQVALVVCLWGGSEADVLAAVLHDTAEDGAAGVRATLGHIGDLFGDAVARRVSVLTKNRTIADPAARAQDHAARVLAALRDIGPGVAAIRLADRLHNCVTSAHLDAARLHALHAHTAQHLAPLAQRLQLPALAGFLGDAPGTWQAVAPAQFVPAMLALQPPWLAAADTAPAASARLAAAWPRDAMAC
jgi:(p)ppGpp synthase/HD superfamily hydrolase